MNDQVEVRAEETLESRWEAAPAVVAVIGLQLALALVSRQLDWKLWYMPWWVWILAVGPEVVLLVALVWDPVLQALERVGHRRNVALILLAIISVENAVALVALLGSLIGGHENRGGQLLLKGMTIWGTNVIAYGLWFWGIDRGGPVRRRQPDPAGCVNRSVMLRAAFVAPIVHARARRHWSWVTAIVVCHREEFPPSTERDPPWHPGAVTVWTIGHGTRPAEELVAVVREAGARTLVDVRRFPGSRHNPQFNEPALRTVLEEGGIAYRHAVELGGRLASEPGEDAFGCLRVAAFRSYAARMGTERWQEALAATLAEPAPCLMCSETLWWRCHRRLIAEFLHARGEHVVHLLGTGKQQEHKPLLEAEARDGRLYLCGALVA